MDIVKVASATDEAEAKFPSLVASATDSDKSAVAKMVADGFFEPAATVTPVQAALILTGHNQHNREVKAAPVNMLAGVLMRGDWRPVHQGIAFYNDGNLMDGQHRLYACVLTDIDLNPVLLSSGYEKEDNDAIDAGTKRTAADAAALEGVQDARIKDSIVKTWMGYKHLSDFGTKATFTAHQVKIEMLANDPMLNVALDVSVEVLENCAVAMMGKAEIASRSFEMLKGGWDVTFIKGLLYAVNQGVAEYEGSPTTYLADAYQKDKSEKSKFNLSALQKAAMWHKTAELVMSRTPCARSAINWKAGHSLPLTSPPPAHKQAAE